MNTHHETNPHFVRPSQEVSFEPDLHVDQQNLRPTTTTPWSGREPRPRHRSGQPQRPRNPPQPRPERQHPPAPLPLAPLHAQLPDEQHPPGPLPLAPLHAQLPDEQHRLEPPRGPRLPDEQHRLEPPRGPRLQRNPFPRRRGGQGSGGGVDDEDADDTLLVPPHQSGPLQQPFDEARHHRDRHHDHRDDGGGGGPRMPQPRRTGAHTWFLAVFCAILWVVVILGGLVVLVVYLVFRPHSPRFEVSDATLNAAYLDGGYLLNADLTLLANFTNPNRKVGIKFSYMYAQLYYGRTLVATQYLEPFTARKGRNMLANLHMVTSQVRLTELEVQRIQRQSLNNNIVFEVKGYFRAKSNFGGLLRYSYWLHGRCTLVLSRPPGGVLVAKRCKTSH